MALSLVSNCQHWSGLSSDVKPSDAGNGSTYHVIDTGEVYFFHDGTWEPDRRLIYAIQQAG